MQKIVIILLFSLLFGGCNADKRHALKEINSMNNTVDSVSDIYKLIDWDSYKIQSSVMSNNIDFIKENIEVVSRIDTNFIQYYGSYSGSAKVLGRILKKRTKKIDNELVAVKTQISNLKHDVRKELITQTDSINIFIQNEKRALELLTNDVNSLKATLLQQKEAFELTHSRVDSLIEIAKQNL